MTTHTITDNDNPPVIQFALSSSTAPENVGTANLTVTLSNPSAFTVTVEFSRDLLIDSASSADATVADGTLTFAPGETSKTIAVQIADDTLDENSEDVIVRLSNPTNGSLGTTTTHTLTITDNDDPPTASFTSDSSTVTEGNVRKSITVTLSTASGKTITVPFSLSGSATEDDDYSVPSHTLTFQPGDTSHTISIDVNADLDPEPDETVIIHLGTPSNATLGNQTQHTLTILDND
jgi:hypothetical protein